MTRGDIRRALRQARRLDASMVPADYREAWRLQGVIVKAAQRRLPWDGGAYNLLAPRYRAEYLEKMGAARRAGNVMRWKSERAGLDIWRSAKGSWLPR